MKAKNAEPTINQDETNQAEELKPVCYDDKIKEIESINDAIVTSVNNKIAYKQKLKSELDFIKGEISKAKSELEKASTEEKYTAADEKLKHYTLQKNYTLQQLQKSDYLKPADYHKYGDTITADYNEMLEDFKKRAIEKCAELVKIVNEYSKFCDLANNAIHNLNNAAGIDSLTVDKDYSNFFKSDLYNSSEEYQYILTAIEKEIGAAAYHELMCLARTPN